MRAEGDSEEPIVKKTDTQHPAFGSDKLPKTTPMRMLAQGSK